MERMTVNGGLKVASLSGGVCVRRLAMPMDPRAGRLNH